VAGCCECDGECLDSGAIWLVNCKSNGMRLLLYRLLRTKLTDVIIKSTIHKILSPIFLSRLTVCVDKITREHQGF
jgi:hypothetical protein